MSAPESLNQSAIHHKLEAFEMTSTWIPGIKILQQINPQHNLFICEKGIQRYGLSQEFFKYLPTREFKNLIFDIDDSNTCLLATTEGLFPGYPETKFFLQRKDKGKNQQMELVIVKCIHSDHAQVSQLFLTQILPLNFQSWATSKVDRIIQEICFKKQNRGKFSQLTERQKEVLRHMVSCTKAEDISEKLEISVNTVNTHKKKIKDILVLEESQEVLWYGLAFDLLKF